MYAPRGRTVDRVLAPHEQHPRAGNDELVRDEHRYEVGHCAAEREQHATRRERSRRCEPPLHLALAQVRAPADEECRHVRDAHEEHHVQHCANV